MNSSVTWDSATSVMSSLCLEIRPSSRSNGPSNTSRCTWNSDEAPAGPSPSGRGGSPGPGAAVISAVVPTAAGEAAAVMTTAVAAVTGTAMVAVMAGHAATIVGGVAALETVQPGPPPLGTAERDHPAEHYDQDHQHDEGSHVYLPPARPPGTCSRELKLSGTAGAPSSPESTDMA